MKITVCDICGKPAIDPDMKKIRIGQERDGVVSTSRELDLCRECLATLSALAERKKI